MLSIKRNWILAAACAALLLSSGAALAGLPGDVAGVWYDPDASDGSGSLTVITRTNIGQYIMESYHCGPPLLAFLGEAKRSPVSGTCVRTGFNEWKFTTMSYIQAEDGTVIAILVGSGTMELPDTDHLRSVDDWALYSPDQDPFGGDPPIYGYFGPYERLGSRVPRVDVR